MISSRRRIAGVLALTICCYLTSMALADTPAKEPGISSAAPASQPTTAEASMPVVQLPNQPPTPGVLGDWFGYRRKLFDEGFTVSAAIYDDYSRNFKGGLSTSKDVNREFTDINFTLTTDQTLHWKGGTFFVNFLNHEGPSGTTELTGDAQMFDTQDAPHSTQLYQIYYQQTFADDQFRLKIGRLDFTTDFDFVNNGADFLNSSFGSSPTILSFPTYPAPALGAVLFWTPTKYFYETVGLSDSNRTDRFGVFAGRPYLDGIFTAGGVIVMEETGANWTLRDDLGGRAAIGMFYNTGTFHRFNGRTQDGAGGPYAVLDQTIVEIAKANKDGTGERNIGIFGQFGLTDPNVSDIAEHIGGGLAWTGPLPSADRAADVVGIGASDVQFSGRAGLSKSHETAIEAFYKLQLTPWFNLQPDLQYIVNPGGTALHDALVATLRLELDF